METSYINGATKLWLYNGDPDSTVHNLLGIYAETGEIFMNTDTQILFFCYQGGFSQLWTQLCYLSQVQSLINALPQADWAQINSSAKDYIKNKPTIPAAQVQSDWTQANNTLPDFIKNKPSIPAAQIQSDWTQASSGAVDFIKNKPTIPAAQVQSDWAQATSSAIDFIKNKPVLAAVATSGAYNDLSGRPSLATVATSGTYLDLTNKPTIPAAQIQSDWTQANSSSVDFIKNKPTIPSSQIQSDWTQTNSSSVDFIKNKPTAMSQSAATRSLNTVFQVSTTRWAIVGYSVDISTTVSLTGSQVGTVFLEIASNAAFTTGVQSRSFSNGNSGTLVVGLVLTQLSTACLEMTVPPGYYVRLRTANVTGTPTYTYQNGQETLLQT